MSNESERVYLTPEQAIAMLPDGDEIHTFLSSGCAIIGANWSRGELIDAIQSAHARELGGETCTRMGHGLVVWTSKDRALFVATKKE